MLRTVLAFLLCTVTLPAFAATDSYRWLHVTIDTPWAIFIFLLPMVLMPGIVMAVLYWRYVNKRPDGKTAAELVEENAAKQQKNQKKV
ncbi:MAG: hypothetical protein OEW58_02870 [Gammaproteobacteria bacterium]|nr:hypothetical protein [Gammaproteobacteria bacterium]